jgi:soluble lytic murein transglycosylase-like protein
MKQIQFASVIVVLFTGNIDAVTASIFSKSTSRKLASVNNEVRLDHAKELLGNKSFQKSAVKKTALFKAVNKFILMEATSALPDTQRHSALRLTNAVIVEANRYNLDPLFLMAVIKHESKFNAEAIGGVGEIGLMQIRPGTGKWIAEMYNIKWLGDKSLNDPGYNIKIGAAYLDYLRRKFDHGQLYLSAYNMGPAAVRSALSRNIRPKEYSSNVMKNYIDFNDQLLTFLNLNDPRLRHQMVAVGD